MTNYPKPANKKNQTQILNKFVVTHLLPTKVLILFLLSLIKTLMGIQLKST